MKKVKQSEIVQQGQQIILPAKMSYDDAIEQLARMRDYENQEVLIRERVNGYYLDGAVAFVEAMRRIYGWVDALPKDGFFGPTPPQMLSVSVAHNETRLVPWGNFNLPGVDGTLSTNVVQDKGQRVLEIAARVLRKHEAEIRRLVEATRQIVKRESIYKGKAFRAAFVRSPLSGGLLEVLPEFLDLGSVNPDDLIFSKEVDVAVRTSVFTPIEHTAAVRAAGVPLKRGVLLSGKYGVGKTLVAYVTAHKAQQHGWTFIYCERADDLSAAIRFAQAYAPAVIFCEDIDRVTSGDRSVNLDDILNTIDGIEAKKSELMVILTTNNVEAINRAMLRPGRLDAVINVLPPDAEAVEKLIRLYGRSLVDPSADLSGVARDLAGQIPAVIRECVERAKLSAIRLNGGPLDKITQQALEDAVLGMSNQLALLNGEQVQPDQARAALETVGRLVANEVAKQL